MRVNQASTISELRWFRWAVLVAGLLVLFVTPPFQAPDEFNHFYRAYQISEGGWLGVKTPDGRLGGILPSSLVEISLSYKALPFHPENQIDLDTVFHDLLAPLRMDRRQFVDFANTAIYAPAGYAPQAFAIAWLRAVDCPPLWMLYAGRLAGFLCWWWSATIAVQLLPWGRRVMMALVLLPSSLAINTSLSPDVLSNGLSFYLIAVLLRALWGQATSIEGTTYWRVALSVVFIGIQKIVYIPLLALAWLKKGNGRWNAARWSWAAMGLVAVMVWTRISGDLFIPYDHYHPAWRDTQQLNEGVDPAGQTRYILNHPIRVIEVVARSLAVTAPATVAHLIGKFGWEKNFLYPPLTAALLAALLALICSETGMPLTFRPVHRWWMAVIGVVMTLALSLLMYVLWNPVGANFIHNLGGKYFIPIAPVWALALVNPVLRKYSLSIWRFLWGIWAICLATFLIQIMERYYFN